MAVRSRYRLPLGFQYESPLNVFMGQFLPQWLQQQQGIKERAQAREEDKRRWEEQREFTQEQWEYKKKQDQEQKFYSDMELLLELPPEGRAVVAPRFATKHPERAAFISRLGEAGKEEAIRIQSDVENYRMGRKSTGSANFEVAESFANNIQDPKLQDSLLDEIRQERTARSQIEARKPKSKRERLFDFAKQKAQLSQDKAELEIKRSEAAASLQDPQFYDKAISDIQSVIDMIDTQAESLKKEPEPVASKVTAPPSRIVPPSRKGREPPRKLIEKYLKTIGMPTTENYITSFLKENPEMTEQDIIKELNRISKAFYR